MKPSSRVLDRNLQELLRRCYQPVVPRAEFVARLERALAPWIDAEASVSVQSSTGRSFPLRRVGLAALAAAAALLLWLVVLPDRGSGTDPSRGTLEPLLAAGEIALRRGEEAPWRAVTPGELDEAIALESGYAELATPVGREAPLRGEGWSLRLRETGRLRLEDAGEGLCFTILSGSARVAGAEGAREVSAPMVLWWREGSFTDRTGAPWPPRELAGEGEVGSREPVEPDRGQAREEPPEEEPTVPPAPGAASLIGTVSVAPGEEPPGSFEVTLLRAVAPPQVAMPETKRFENSGGAFRWDDIAPGRYSLFVQAPGWAVHRVQGLDLLTDTSREVDVRLARGGTIIGYVVDRENGAAIAGALVVSERELPMQVIPSKAEELPEAARAFTFTRADGSFELTEMSSGGHRLRAGGTRHAPSWSDSIVVTAGETTDGVILELGPGGGVTGRVEYPDGRPRPGVLVVVSRYSGVGEFTTMTYASAITDEKGEYLAESLAPGMYVVLEFGDGSVEAREREPRYTPTRIEEGRVTRVDFLGKGAGAILSGTIHDGRGVAISRANVYLAVKGDRWTAWEGDTATTEGLFAIEGIVPGDYWLYAGIGDSFVMIEHLTFQAGEEKAVEVVLSGRTLDVHVADAVSGAPLPDAIVMLFEASPDASDDDETGLLVARTWFGSDGDYHLDSLPAGTFDMLVVAEGGGYAPSWHRDVLIAPEGGDEKISVELERAGAVQVRVVDSVERPLQGALVQVTRSSPAAIHHHTAPEAEHTDSAGEARIRYLLPGKWTVRVHLDGYRERIITIEVAAELVTEVPVVLGKE